jgi:hypothetical protein
MILILNGPPGSGKDKACLYLKQKGVKHLSFKYHLFTATADHFNVDLKWFMKDYDDRILKEQPEEKLNGYSRRTALIHVSENIIKPLYGKDFFGVKASEEIAEQGQYCFSDGGFQEELAPIINKFGAKRIVIIQLTREGCDFSSDSRRYFNGNLVQEYVLGHETKIYHPYILKDKIDIRTYRVHNNLSLQSLYMTLEKIHEKESNVQRVNQQEGEKDQSIL